VIKKGETNTPKRGVVAVEVHQDQPPQHSGPATWWKAVERGDRGTYAATGSSISEVGKQRTTISRG